MAKYSLTGKTTTTIANHEYVRLNDIADRFGKRLDNWMRLQNTKDLIESFRKDYASQNQEPFNVVMGRMAVEAIDEILDEESGESPLKTVKGGTTVLKNTDKDGVKELIQQGTWAHPVLAQKLIEWCDRSPRTSPERRSTIITPLY